MTTDIQHLSERAQKCRSTAQVRNMLARAERMAEYYARLLAGWPAIVEHAQREVELVRRRLDELIKLDA